MVSSRRYVLFRESPGPVLILVVVQRLCSSASKCSKAKLAVNLNRTKVTWSAYQPVRSTKLFFYKIQHVCRVPLPGGFDMNLKKLMLLLLPASADAALNRVVPRSPWGFCNVRLHSFSGPYLHFIPFIYPISLSAPR